MSESREFTVTHRCKHRAAYRVYDDRTEKVWMDLGPISACPQCLERMSGFHVGIAWTPMLGCKGEVRMIDA